jgi:aryl-phospho-beta-D-glucosidase BglC (GH1 family)
VKARYSDWAVCWRLLSLGALACTAERTGPDRLGSVAQAAEPDVYHLQALHSGLCLEVANASSENGANVQQSSCTDADNQKWKLVPRADGSYRLRAEHSGKCLVARGKPGDSGDNIQQGRCRFRRSKWRLLEGAEAEDDIVQLQSKKSDLCADVEGGSGSEGANVLQWDCHTGDNQRFRLLPEGGQGGAGGTGGSGGTGGQTVGQSIVLEAEDYTSCYDNTPGNEGGYYRDGDADLGLCSEGGFVVGWTESGEWLEYAFELAEADTFDIYAHVASVALVTAAFSLRIDGVDVSGPVSVPNTLSWQTWEDVVVRGIGLGAGPHSLRVLLGGSISIDYLHIASATRPPPPPARPGSEPPPERPADYVGPVTEHGQLQVVGSQLCDESGTPVQLRGIASHGLQWSPPIPRHTIPNLAYDWGISVFRPPMYVEDYKNGEYWAGYLAQPEHMRQQVINAVEDALDANIYVLVDWHIHNDPSNFTADAVAFFREMAGLYGQYPNIIYEICNEPEYVDWAVVKAYANTVIAEIRSIDPDNLILVGTPNWCQDVEVAADDPLVGYTNLMYTLHFYSGSHTQPYRDKAAYALSQGLPLFITEWGTSSYDGGSSQQVYLDEARAWIDWADANRISWINWTFCNKAEASSALQAGVSLVGPWSDSELSPSGAFVKGRISAP